MYISKSFIPILKNNPSEAKIKSHQLMLRVGMIKQSSTDLLVVTFRFKGNEKNRKNCKR